MSVSAYFANLFSEYVQTDDEGNITNIDKSDLVLASDYSKLETRVTTAEGNIVDKATIETMIKDGISSATITADRINFSGQTTTFNTGEIVINSDNFKLDKDGNVTIYGIFYAKAIHLQVADADDIRSGSLLINGGRYALPELARGEYINIKIVAPLITRSSQTPILVPASKNVNIWDSSEPRTLPTSNPLDLDYGVYDLIGYRGKGEDITHWVVS